MSPRVSVVMATYNRAQLVGRAIASVRGQSLVDWEMICVDDGSTDETAAVIQAIGEPRVRLIRLPRIAAPATPGTSASTRRGGPCRLPRR
jgi:glycosyltransferase involved in cell wall biosynthesis